MTRHYFRYLFFFIWLLAPDLKAQNINAVDSLINVYESLEEKGDSTTFYTLISISRHHPDPEKKIYFASEALKMAENEDDDLWKAHCYNQIGYGYKWKGDLDMALDYFYKSINGFKKVGYDSGTAAVLSSIGDTYSLIEDHQKAIRNYKKAISILEKLNEEYKLSTVMLNLGDEFLNTNELDSALYYTDLSLDISERENNKSGIGYALGNKALILARKDKTDSAILYLKESIEVLESLGDSYSVSLFINSLAKIYKQQGKRELAMEHASNSLTIARNHGLKEQIRDACLILSELYKEMGDFERAYQYQNQYISYRDSINNEEVIRQMAEMRANYEIAGKQAEVDLLEAKNQQQKIINYALALGVFMLLILAFIIYQNSQKRKEVNQLLSDQKEEIKIQRDQLEELVQMKDRFFGIISHDLRSPVNSLQGITQILRYYVKENNIEQIKEFAALADQSIHNLSALLDNLLSWALSQQGNLPYNPEEISYYFIAEEVKNIFSNIAVSKNISLETHVSKDFKVYCDRDGVFALTRNLINNSIKFTPPNGKVSIYTESKDGQAVIRFKDSGVGISKEKLATLFHFDKKTSTKGTAGEKGSGLGLALCKDIVDANNGRIEVESELNKGTTFSVYLPSSKGK